MACDPTITYTILIAYVRCDSEFRCNSSVREEKGCFVPLVESKKEEVKP